MAALIQVMMACGGFSPERALTISTCFFAMTTGAMDVTVNALNLWGPRPWPTFEAVHTTAAF